MFSLSNIRHWVRLLGETSTNLISGSSPFKVGFMPASSNWLRIGDFQSPDRSSRLRAGTRYTVKGTAYPPFILRGTRLSGQGIKNRAEIGRDYRGCHIIRCFMKP